MVTAMVIGIEPHRHVELEVGGPARRSGTRRPQSNSLALNRRSATTNATAPSAAT
jgi:hypothetical protein